MMGRSSYSSEIRQVRTTAFSELFDICKILSSEGSSGRSDTLRCGLADRSTAPTVQFSQCVFSQPDL
ncbi:hypothetical protein E6O75_ATG09971 [Venturia nashicola]|uniref:Uncharacterized protein n=1 Tax=Venturia nashicola TaxID=86259 RepID=A0A4Z1NJR0_9PEZI|nr:hypothetical protein E6O75_ATG09971 [Venturia nashicola]